MSPLSRRRGFTLVELLIALTVAGIAAAAIYQAILGTQRITRAQFQRMDVQQSTRAAAFYLSGAMRELSASDGDLKILQPTMMQYRAMRWSGVLCSPVVGPVGGNVATVLRDNMLFGTRGPDAVLDSLLLFRDDSVTTRGDDEWLIGDVRGVTGGAVCADGSPGTTLQFRIASGSGGNDSALVGVTVGSPIRGYQLEEVQLYAVDGANWLGQRSMDRGGSWTPWRPLVGPLTAAGLAFTYLDSTGTVTATLTDVATVALTIRGRSAELARVGSGMDYVRDSLFTSVALRNNARF